MSDLRAIWLLFVRYPLRLIYQWPFKVPAPDWVKRTCVRNGVQLHLEGYPHWITGVREI